MFSATLLVDDDILDAFSEAARQSPRLTAIAYRRAIRPLASRMLEDLRRQPQAARKPFIWKSERQRRFVMAKLTEDNNLPYQRTGDLSAGWDVELDTTDDGGILQATNDVSYTEFVQGDFAQPGHLATGWIQAAEVIAKYREAAEDVLIETWFTIVDKS